jgi:hypothetical protein
MIVAAAATTRRSAAAKRERCGSGGIARIPLLLRRQDGQDGRIVFFQEEDRGEDAPFFATASNLRQHGFRGLAEVCWRAAAECGFSQKRNAL